MKKYFLIVILFAFNFKAISQDTISDNFTINAGWVNPEQEVIDTTLKVQAIKLPEFVEKIIPSWISPDSFFEKEKEEELTEEEVKALEKDVEFLAELPQSYEDVPKEDLKNVLVQIDNKINDLKKEIADLIAARNANQDLIKTKKSTLTTLEKEKSIIGLTIKSGDLKNENGDLSNENSNLRTTKEQLKRYLYIAIGGLSLVFLVIAIFLQRRRIQVQDVELEKQLDDINKKNTYLEHAARIIRHDMHSGINTYMPRGLSSLERRLSDDDIEKFKISAPLKMIKDGLSHTQRVYKSVYEFTNLVKTHVVLDKEMHNVKEVLERYLNNTSYGNQVQISDLMELEINETLFCNAIDNLIRNGLKYNDSQEKWVKVYTEGNYIVVQDNGRGMTKGQFEKAIRAETGENSKNEIGLGLSICNAILKEHGFSFTCEKSEGQGTLIKINTKN
jgi:signal transduction histidine kinase